jgi:hypothetical protein
MSSSALTNPSPLLRESIQSILDQEGVAPFLHLVDTGNASKTFDEFSGRWNVRRHSPAIRNLSVDGGA